VVIKRDPDAAVYRQLAAELRAQIADGRLQPGALVPSEAALMQTYGFARETVRRAIRELRIEGLVIVQPGRGTWVRPEVDRQIEPLLRGTDFEVRMPTAAECDAHGLAQGVPVLVIHRGGTEQLVSTVGKIFTVR